MNSFILFDLVNDNVTLTLVLCFVAGQGMHVASDEGCRQGQWLLVWWPGGEEPSVSHVLCRRSRVRVREDRKCTGEIHDNRRVTDSQHVGDSRHCPHGLWHMSVCIDWTGCNLQRSDWVQELHPLWTGSYTSRKTALTYSWRNHVIKTMHISLTIRLSFRHGVEKVQQSNWNDSCYMSWIHHTTWLNYGRYSEFIHYHRNWGGEINYGIAIFKQVSYYTVHDYFVVLNTDGG